MSFLKYILLTVIITAAVKFPVYAEKADIYGYYEPQYMVINVNSPQQNMLNKLRVDLKSAYSDNISFGSNVNILRYSGSSTVDLTAFLPGRITDAIPAGIRGLYVLDYKDDILLDNAFAKFSFAAADLTLGKQQIALGTGYAWNPTDVFNNKDSIDPSYEQPGHNGVRADIPFGSRSGLLLFYEPEDRWEDSGRLMRIKGGLGHFDFSGIYIRRDRELTDFTDFSSFIIKREVYGADFAGELIGLGVWGEYAYNMQDVKSDFRSFVAGADYTFLDGTYVMCEYFHSDEAQRDYRDMDINSWMRYITGEVKAIIRDQAYIYTDFPVTDLINGGCSSVVSLNDGSFTIIPSLDYSFMESAELSLFLSINIGDPGTPYDSGQGVISISRIRVYW